jgi:hypothetical protein
MCRLNQTGGLGEPIESLLRLLGHAVDFRERCEQKWRRQVATRGAQKGYSLEDQRDALRCMPHRGKALAAHDVSSCGPQGKTLLARDGQQLIRRQEYRGRRFGSFSCPVAVPGLTQSERARAVAPRRAPHSSANAPDRRSPGKAGSGKEVTGSPRIHPPALPRRHDTSGSIRGGRSRSRHGHQGTCRGSSRRAR